LGVVQAKVQAKEYEAALVDLKVIAATYAETPSAPSAQLLIGNVYERQERLDDAQVAYSDVRTRYGSSAAAAEATYALANLVLRTKRDDRDLTARALFGELAAVYPKSSLAPMSLWRLAGLEDRANLRVQDPELQAVVPASLVSYRRIVRTYPGAPIAESAFDALSNLYQGLRRYDLAAQTLEQFATQFPNNRRDAAWRAGEMYEDRLKDMAKARTAYRAVPPTSSNYRDAQRKLR
jgi:TolA-binding protein